MSTPAPDLPTDYLARVRSIRTRLELTQAQFAERIGVSFATVNRWENNQSKPNRLAWRQLLDLEAAVLPPPEPPASPSPTLETTPTIDFAASPAAVAAVAEANRLNYGHLFNLAFATETSLIDPLPHQRIAVYEQMLKLSPLRFLLADDAGAGKTIMTGLYLREVLARRLINRVLIVPPAGLVGNWERELSTLFRLHFRIVVGADARLANPFVGPESDRLIISLDTLAGERMFARLRESLASGAARPYDLVVFDEAHKLSADREHDFYIRKTDRYRLAEALAGIPSDDPRWSLGWSAAHLLLLTATPHMGKDFPYYCLWRLLAPDALPTFDAFQTFPDQKRRRFFIRRTKEELVRYDGRPLYPERNCDTLSYDLTSSETELYDATTRYLNETYNKARILNRSAARLAMSVFQRRQASSTYALLRSFERRIERLGNAIELVAAGRIEELERSQKRIAGTPDFFETCTADEDAPESSDRERHEEFEDTALGGLVALHLADLRAERAEVQNLLSMTRRIAGLAEDSKFEKLRAVLRDPAFAQQKFIIFTEHRDTAEFLVCRLEGLGFTGQVAFIHGGLPYRAREAQVELFRRPLEEGGANYLVATDAAGEGINLQFCWLMVNYDVPWNPARLEQRMGRIHRYGQRHDPVIIVNLIAGKTREGRVLKTLLDKLELIRKRLRSDKVFDVVGRLFQNLSLKAYLEMATTEEGTQAAIDGIEGLLTEQQVRALAERERALFGGGDVRSQLPALNAALEQEQYRRLLPGYVRRFIESAAPLIDLHVDGDPEGTFGLAPERPRALDPLLGALESYPRPLQHRLTFYRPQDPADVVWLHPGEPVFDRFSATLLSRYAVAARRGAIFIDPNASSPYLFHLAELSVLRRPPADESTGLLAATAKPNPSELVETSLFGLRQENDGTITRCPVEHLLLLRGATGVPPGSVSLARRAAALTPSLLEWLNGNVLAGMIDEHRARIENGLPERLDWVSRGYDYRAAELIASRQHLNIAARRGDTQAEAELANVRARQRALLAEKDSRLAALRTEPTLIVPGEAVLLAHALVLPTEDPEERRRHDAEVESIAMQFVRAHEEASGATVHDVSRPELAKRHGFTDWPGFDLQAKRPAGPHGPAEDRAIEVKGRAGSGSIEISENEWATACTHRNRYWLYVIFDCATPRPRLLKVQDPFGKLLAKSKGSLLIAEAEILSAANERMF